MALRMRPYNEREIELINSLIREGEYIYGRSESRGHLVQDYVNEETSNHMSFNKPIGYFSDTTDITSEITQTWE